MVASDYMLTLKCGGGLGTRWLVDGKVARVFEPGWLTAYPGKPMYVYSSLWDIYDATLPKAYTATYNNVLTSSPLALPPAWPTVTPQSGIYPFVLDYCASNFVIGSNALSLEYTLGNQWSVDGCGEHTPLYSFWHPHVSAS